MRFQDYLKENRVLMDGAMGTYFASLKKNKDKIAELANIEEASLIEKIHKSYIDAGAVLLRTNTFAANCTTMKITKEEQKIIIKSAIKIAKNAIGEKKDIFLAADIGPIPIDEKEEKEILEEYEQICQWFLEENISIFLFETFSDLNYLKQVVTDLRKKSDVFIITSFCVNKNGYTNTGINAAKLLKEIENIEEIDACGFNCAIGSGHLYQLLGKMMFPQKKYIIAAPNAGYPEQFQNRMMFMNNVEYFSENIKKACDLGIDIMGGCCGTNPNYIKEIAKCVPQKISLETRKKQRNKISIVEVDKKKVDVPNLFSKLAEQNKKIVAVELDPPFNANYEKLIECAHYLKKNGVNMITIADSPMGRSRVDSILMSIKLEKEVKVPVMPHICCRDKNRIAMHSTILGAYINGIRNLLIVTGDPVADVSAKPVFDYNSIRLMKLVQEMNKEHFEEAPICYGGALNYGRGILDKVIERMEKKIKAGASYFLTQPVFSDTDIEKLKYIKMHTNTKILCGLMPLVSYRNANFIKNEIAGIEIPDKIIEKYEPNMTKEEAEKTGADVVNKIIEKLSSFADGYYFMLPFNRVTLMNKIKIQ